MNGVIALRRLTPLASGAIAVVCLFDLAEMVALRRLFSENQLLPISLLLMLIAGVLFLWWLGRARRNLLEFKGEERRFTPGWTIGAWFIPLANLVLPGLVTADIAEGSSTDPATLRRLRALVWFWWGCFALNTAVGYAARFVSAYETELSLLGNAVYLAAGVLAIVMMFQITAAQWIRFAAVQRPPDPADFPTFTVDELRGTN